MRLDASRGCTGSARAGRRAATRPVQLALCGESLFEHGYQHRPGRILVDIESGSGTLGQREAPVSGRLLVGTPRCYRSFASFTNPQLNRPTSRPSRGKILDLGTAVVRGPVARGGSRDPRRTCTHRPWMGFFRHPPAPDSTTRSRSTNRTAVGRSRAPQTNPADLRQDTSTIKTCRLPCLCNLGLVQGRLNSKIIRPPVITDCTSTSWSPQG